MKAVLAGLCLTLVGCRDPENVTAAKAALARDVQAHLDHHLTRASHVPPSQQGRFFEALTPLRTMTRASLAAWERLNPAQRDECDHALEVGTVPPFSCLVLTEGRGPMLDGVSAALRREDVGPSRVLAAAASAKDDVDLELLHVVRLSALAAVKLKADGKADEAAHRCLDGYALARDVALRTELNGALAAVTATGLLFPHCHSALMAATPSERLNASKSLEVLLATLPAHDALVADTCLTLRLRAVSGLLKAKDKAALAEPAQRYLDTAVALDVETGTVTWEDALKLDSSCAGALEAAKQTGEARKSTFRRMRAESAAFGRGYPDFERLLNRLALFAGRLTVESFSVRAAGTTASTLPPPGTLQLDAASNEVLHVTWLGAGDQKLRADVPLAGN